MRSIDKISDTMSEKVLQRIEARVKLKKTILEYITKEFKVNPRSKHIPPSLKREIVDAIYKKYRLDMDAVGLVVNYSLQFAKK